MKLENARVIDGGTAVEVTLDGRALLFVLAVSAAAAVTFGLGPAFFFWRTDLHDALKDGAGTSFGASRAGLRVRGEHERTAVARHVGRPEVRSLIERLTIDDSGKFLRRDGSELPW